MAHTLSALKRLRQNERRRERNHQVKVAVKTQIKRVLEVLKRKTVKEPTKILEELRKAESMLDRAASKGVLHRNNAARRKARLAQRVQARLADRSS